MEMEGSVFVDAVSSKDLLEEKETVGNWWVELDGENIAKSRPKVACSISSKKKISNFVKSLLWSPDGTCLLSNCEDNVLRLHESNPNLIAQDYDFIPSIDPVLSMDHGEIIYDYCWLPTMTTTDPKTCFFFTTSKGHPIRMWDAFSGRLAASYRGYNAADELDSSTAIIVTDQQIFAGFQKSIKIFQLDTPGRSYTSVPIPKDATSGIRSVSTIAIQDPSRKYDFSRVVAVGMHHNKVGLLSAQGDQDWIGWIDNKVAENDKNCGTGVSKVLFSPDSRMLFCGSRKSDKILCFDMYRSDMFLTCFPRSSTTNQKMQFDVSSDGKYLFTGDSVSGNILVYSLQNLSGDVQKPIASLQEHKDSVAGIALNPQYSCLASGSGQRHFELEDVDDSLISEGKLEGTKNTENSNNTKKRSIDEMATSKPVDSRILLWSLPFTTVSYSPQKIETATQDMDTVSGQ